MIDIVIIIVVIGLVISLFNAIISVIALVCKKIYEYVTAFANAVGPINLVVTLILAVVMYFNYSWKGVCLTLVVGLGGSVILKALAKMIRNHDKERRAIAQMNKETQQKKLINNNQLALQNELDKNCRWLGAMSSNAWLTKLPNYANKEYETDFETITTNFARQMEEQNIRQNDDWVKPYIENIVKSNQGKSVIQLLNTVTCPQLMFTHITPNEQLLGSKFDELTKRVSDDVPAMLEKRQEVYFATKYAQKLYGGSNFETNNHNQVIEDDSL